LIIAWLQRISSDEAWCDLSVIKLPHRADAQAAAIGRIDFSVDLVAWAKSGFRLFAYFMSLGVLAKCFA
jgi:hypothetical protein